MKVFITGVAGFIGSTLAERLLREGHFVSGIDNLATGYESNIPKGLKWIKGDISEPENFRKTEDKYDVIVHLAAQNSGEKSFEMPEYDAKTNVLGSFYVYEYAKKCGAKLMVNMSSMSVYGDVPELKVVDESYRPEPVSLYGNSKYAAENMLRLLSGQDSFPVFSLRLFNAYGPKQDLKELKQGMVSIYLAQFLYHEKVIVKGSFERVRDIIYVDDIVDAIIQITKSGNTKGGVFNLSYGEITSVGKLIEKISKILGSSKEVVNSGTTKGDVMGFGGNNKKFCETFKWKPEVSIDEGLKKMIDYYR